MLYSSLLLALFSIPVVFSLFKVTKYFLRMKTEYYWSVGDNYGSARFVEIRLNFQIRWTLGLKIIMKKSMVLYMEKFGISEDLPLLLLLRPIRLLFMRWQSSLELIIIWRTTTYIRRASMQMDLFMESTVLMGKSKSLIWRRLSSISPNCLLITGLYLIFISPIGYNQLLLTTQQFFLRKYVNAFSITSISNPHWRLEYVCLLSHLLQTPTQD